MPKADKDKTKILSKNLFPVVGIGASAGGLEAFKKLIKAIPEKTGMAYILVQHLHPDHSSALPEILQRETKMRVNEISDNVKVKPDEVYIIPANKMLVASDGVLQLSPRPSKDHKNMPIDMFFSSLAEVHQSHAIGVVLSGNGIDGTLGLKNIKDNGGITFAQDLDSAAYDAMPQSAIKAGVVDFILAPENIPGQLLALNRTLKILSLKDDAIPEELTEEESFKHILSLLRISNGVDFTYYKQTTIRRRILRRMVFLKLEKIADYLVLLKQNKPEQDLLFQDMLIPVTAFFRDPKTFENLCSTVLPELIKNKSSVDPLRIWVAGCSSGKEAYSIGMCIHEYLSDKISTIRIQIFATDVSEKSIAKARAGIYDKTDMEGVSDERMQQFFTNTNGSYHVKKVIRDMCVFAMHNFLKDPPFAKIDLISCRNVLIYLEPFLQKKAFTIFHYALNQKGYLWLGKSETTGSFSQYFLPFGKKEKFYTRKAFPGRFMNVASERSEETLRDKDFGIRINERKRDDFQKDADDILLSKYAPAGVIVNDQMDIVQFRGSTGDFLEPSPGKASLNVLKMAREGLAFELRNALQKAKRTKEPFSKENIPVNNGEKIVTIEVIPLLNTVDLHFLILFKDSDQVSGIRYQVSGNKKPGTAKVKDPKDIRIKQLEKDMSQGREDMRSITEDQEAVNEELQSANEELLSGSEELQSLNEELETSKEELQSTNEELITVNQELFDRNEQFNQARLYAEAIVTTIHEPLLVLNQNFTIKSANNSFYKNFLITEEETIGKILFDLQNNGWNIPGLRSQLLKIQTGNEKFLEWEATYTFPEVEERTICFNAQPFQKENREHWILLAMEDITKRKQATRRVAESEAFNRTILENSPDCVKILDAEGRLQFMNSNGRCLMDIDDFTQFKNKHWWDLWGEDSRQMIKDAVAKAVNGEKTQFQVFNPTAKGIPKWWDVIVLPLQVPEGIKKIPQILSVSRDITQQKQQELKERELLTRFQNLVEKAPVAICVLRGRNYVVEVINDGMFEMWDRTLEEVLNKPAFDVLTELRDQGFKELLDNVYNKGERFVAEELPINLRRNGKLESAFVKFIYEPLREADGTISGVMALAHEITEQVVARKRIEESETQFRQMANLMPAKITNANAQGDFTYYNQTWSDYTGLSFEELKNGGWEKSIHPDEVEEIKKQWLHSLETGDDLEFEFRILNKQGEYKWHLCRIGGLKDDNGKIQMWISVATDIHDQKTKEEVKDEFIGIASHELKTPLTTAKAYIHLLEMSMEKEKNKDLLYAQKAGASIDRLNNLIGELLDVSKIQSGKLPMHISTFNFDEMISAAIEEVQYSSPNHSIIKSGQTNKHVTGDMERLKQVVINLLTNAVKYSPKADKVFVNVIQENGEVKVSVKDSGIGIRKENIGKIFERYYREEDRAVHFQGLGIGLSICIEIIQRHKGKIWAESEPGQGSTFYFTVPM